MEPALSSWIRYRMEILDEFDNEYPLSISFCKRISLGDFEEQSLSYTRQCLHKLYPWSRTQGSERALREQKQMEKYEAGLISEGTCNAVLVKVTGSLRLLGW